MYLSVTTLWYCCQCGDAARGFERQVDSNNEYCLCGHEKCCGCDNLCGRTSSCDDQRCGKDKHEETSECSDVKNFTARTDTIHEHAKASPAWKVKTLVGCLFGCAMVLFTYSSHLALLHDSSLGYECQSWNESTYHDLRSHCHESWLIQGETGSTLATGTSEDDNLQGWPRSHSIAFFAAGITATIGFSASATKLYYLAGPDQLQRSFLFFALAGSLVGGLLGGLSVVTLTLKMVPAMIILSFLVSYSTKVELRRECAAFGKICNDRN